MSRVFVARELALGRTVVVKVIAPELAEGLSAKRFAREVKLAARLQQANIVPVLNTGESIGLPWYVMPYVSGESLRARIASGRQPSIADAVNILRDVARALAYAHGEGIVHRDIKPENILISGGAAVVTDFGIAKALTSSRTQDGVGGFAGTITQLGTVIGTPAYMAPEQAAGDPNIDHRADVYAWGVVAWELIAGTHPFAARTTQQALIAAHISETPVALAAARPDVPAALAALVAQCLEKDPALRPASAADVVDALDRAGVTGTASGLSPLRRRLSRRTQVAIAAGVAILAIGVWAATQRMPRGAAKGTRDKSLAVLPFESVGGDTANTYFAEGMADELTTALAKVNGLRVAATSSAFTYRDKTADVREVGRALNVSAVLQGRVRREGTRMRVSAQLTNARDGLLLWSNSYEREVKDVFAVQDEITRDIVGALRVTLAGGTVASAQGGTTGTSDLEAYDLYLRGNFFLQQRGAGVARSIGYFKQSLARDSMYARAWAQLGTAYNMLPLFTVVRADAAIRDSRAAVEHALQLDPSSAEAYAALGTSHVLAAEWTEARRAFERAVALDPGYPITYRAYMTELYCEGRFDESIAQGRIGSRLDPLAPTMHALFSIFLLASNKRTEALDAARRASELDSLSPLVRPALAAAEYFNGHTEVAHGMAERAPRVTQSMPAIGFLLAATGDRQGATAIIRESEGLRGHSAFAESTVALTYLGAGDTTRALDALERAAQAREPIMFTAPLGHPYYDGVRHSARFAAVIRLYGLDPAHFGAGPRGPLR